TIIRRGHDIIVAPKADEVLLPCDRLYLIGTYEQLVLAQAVIEFHPEEELELDGNQFGMVSFRPHPEHVLVGKAIRDCEVRESVNGLIVGIERKGERFLNPDPDMVIEGGDIVWIVGDIQALANLDAYQSYATIFTR
ncbi:MAG: TrkA C-terminal domain-containing protein, partial [Planctomycetaceae bacterium]|nr:TrkA C-terminal domain-containing protein [Planctomycetaceae bacterium]